MLQRKGKLTFSIRSIVTGQNSLLLMCGKMNIASNMKIIDFLVMGCEG
jgi:hypothetical protein